MTAPLRVIVDDSSLSKQMRSDGLQCTLYGMEGWGGSVNGPLHSQDVSKKVKLNL